MINVNQLSFSINKQCLFDKLSFCLPEGKIGAILGPNGRGKTTLLRLLLGFQRNYTGQISLNAQVAYVPQLNPLLFSYSVQTMVSLGRLRHLAWYQSPTSKDKKIVADCLDYLRLTPFADKPFNQLSGGEKQMVMIGRALASEPQILILDEPTSALDLHNQDLILAILRELAQSRHLTILFTSHYPQHALHIAQYSLLLHRACPVVFGSTAEVVTEKALTELYQIPIAIEPIKHNNGTTQAVVPLFH